MTRGYFTKRNATSMLSVAACAVALCGCRTAPPLPNIDSSRFQPDAAKADAAKADAAKADAAKADAAKSAAAKADAAKGDATKTTPSG
jgi:hypothetical protein